MMTTGRDIIEVAEEKLGQEYFFGARVPLDDRDWRGPWDCAEYCSWAVYQVSKKNYGCTNNNNPPSKADAWTGSWKRDAESLGILISVPEAAHTPGAMLLRRGSSSGHIAISDGSGNGTLEARGRLYGVVRYVVKNRDWDMGVKVPWIGYATPKIAIATDEYISPFTYRIFEKEVLRGDGIAGLQNQLLKLGFFDGIISGVFDVQTEVAVRDFQISAGLTPDGQVDVETAEELNITVDRSSVEFVDK